MDAKQKKIVLISVGGVVVFATLCFIGTAIFVFTRSLNQSGPEKLITSTQGAPNQVRTGQMMDLSNICERQMFRGNIATPEDLPDDVQLEAPKGGFSEMSEKIDEICKDDKVTDSEKEELQKFFQDMPRPTGMGRMFRNNRNQ